MPRLDGLRCLAVLGVLPVHFVSGWTSHWYSDTGDFGVKLFFVLSGYLITSILLSYRDRIDQGLERRRRGLLVFYVRRMLRLSPVYYAYLFLASLSLPGIRPYLGWYFCYAQNFLFAAKPVIHAKYLAHFWTLAIEEQFYLVAPILVLTVPRRSLRALAVAFVTAGALFRAVGLGVGVSAFALNLMMPAQMDTLGMGMLLAVLRWQDGFAGRTARILQQAGWMIGLPITVGSRVAGALGVPQGVLFVLDNIGLGLLLVAVVGGATAGSNERRWRVLEFAPLVFVGRISYGMYVYHFNVPGLARDIFPRLGLSLPTSELLRFCVLFAITLTIATASFYLYEQRFNRLKDRFALRRKNGTTQALAESLMDHGGRLASHAELTVSTSSDGASGR